MTKIKLNNRQLNNNLTSILTIGSDFRKSDIGGNSISVKLGKNTYQSFTYYDNEDLRDSDFDKVMELIKNK
tara:strand:+ start:692 stop:904 length:213 start_codon:yes stop_codon:yes gene_type:complete